MLTTITYNETYSSTNYVSTCVPDCPLAMSTIFNSTSTYTGFGYTNSTYTCCTSNYCNNDGGTAALAGPTGTHIIFTNIVLIIRCKNREIYFKLQSICSI